MLIVPTAPVETLGYTCGERECDGVGNINGEVDWIEPSQVEDPSLIAATKASGMINIDKGIIYSRCSATIIASDLILTNHHCVPDEETASSVSFIPETEREASVYQRFSRRFSCQDLVATNCAHDLSILRFKPDRKTGKQIGEVYSVAQLSLTDLYRSDQVNLIHTNCDYREEIGNQSCTPIKLISPGQVLSYGPQCIRFNGEPDCNNCRSEAYHATHTADSLGGSSGGGIFDVVTHSLIGVNWGGLKVIIKVMPPTT